MEESTVLRQRIVVLLHRDVSMAESARYLLELLTARWQETGVSIEIVHGIDRVVDADLVIPHLNLTVVPPFRGPEPSESVLELTHEMAEAIGNLQYV
jgi:hypothetical protein